MSKQLSGLVAIVRNGAVAELRDLGPVPVGTKDHVFPVVYQVTDRSTGQDTVVTDAEPVIGAGEVTIVRTIADRPAPTPAERVDEIFPQTDTAQALLGMFHQIANSLDRVEDYLAANAAGYDRNRPNTISRAQVRSVFEGLLP